jgi:hypothetical protein
MKFLQNCGSRAAASIKTASAAAAIFGCSFSVSAQNMLLVYSSNPGILKFFDSSGSQLSSRPIWGQNEGGLAVQVPDMSQAFISAEGQASLKLSDKNRTTKLISINREQRLSLESCFSAEKYCCESLSDRQRSGTEKIMAVSVMKKSADELKPVVFTKGSRYITGPADLLIEWRAEIEWETVFLVELSSMETVWSSSSFSSFSFTAADIAANGILLNDKAEYQLTVRYREASGAASNASFIFEHGPLAFADTGYHFVSKEAMHISWKSREAARELVLMAGEQILWKGADAGSSFFNIGSLPADVAASISPGTEYQLAITMQNGAKYNYSFMVLVDNEESLALKELVPAQ